MGLDQYLTRKVYVGANYSHRNVTGKIDVYVGEEKLNIDFNKVSYIEEQIGYWRKANAVHSWFVNVVQDGEDDCQPHYVSEENLQQLLKICNLVLGSTKLVPGKVWNGQQSTPDGWMDIWEEGKVLENSTLAEEFLPTQDGFFFGSTKYDEYYWQDILDTKKIVEDALALYDANSEIYYCSSW